MIEYFDPSVRESDPLAPLGDLDSTREERRLADVLLPDPRQVGRVASDVVGAAQEAAQTDWTRFSLIGAGMVLGSSLLDKSADRLARKHGDGRWVHRATTFGNALPVLALGGAAVAAIDNSDPQRAKTAFAALEAGGVSFLATTGFRYLVGRERPGDHVSNYSFKFRPSSGSRFDSFPSRHAIMSWAAATPFAEHYNAPWLYGVAGITNFGRVAGRQHWFSDTVAGSVLGYAIGKWFYDASRVPEKGMPRVSLERSGVNLAWEFQ